MAQMELIHWECKGSMSETAPPLSVGQVTYMCIKCNAVFVCNDDGSLQYWYKTRAMELDKIIAPAVDVAELAREISCEGRVM